MDAWNMARSTLIRLKSALKQIIKNEGWIPDQESFDLFQQIIPWPASEVCLVNDRGELLLHLRHFKEWPAPWNKIHDWYIPGGFMKTYNSIEQWCAYHLKKDGITAEFEFLGTIDALKWKQGDHPTSNLISLLCVCRLIGKATFISGTENNFKWVGQTVKTGFPNHTELQDRFFTWRDRNEHLFPEGRLADAIAASGNAMEG